ncbi:MAG: 1-deoxy-D-xylulose-5-phosphate synthase [Candidatus Diapherotrites archaeon CG08_land_8_20_14_0_20_30_16]|nr:MAG: 1-deoxy-D-xylulose-5-phosphate synthase [Candidatus Diapherotrites archaeon CG08_land_8_20_14_0_20_30_16]
MRNVFVNKLFEYAKKDSNILLLTGDLGYGLFDNFRFNLPKQFINVGIAEQNMINIASGLSYSGKNVFVYSIIPFLLMRPFEGIRLNISYNNLPVKLLGAGGGLLYGAEGPTHHAYEDIGLLRLLPNVTIFCPGDKMEIDNLLEDVINYKSPIYIRFGGNVGGSIYSTKQKFKLGKGNIVVKGKEIVIFSMGTMLKESYLAVKELNKYNIFPTLISMHTIKPLDVDLIKKYVSNSKQVYVVEDHKKTGGLFSAILENIPNVKHNATFYSLSLPDKFIADVGDNTYLYKKYGLTYDNITELILKERGDAFE